MNILLIEPYLTDSHRSWAEGYQSASAHTVRLLTLPGRHWKWRMHGAAVHFAEVCSKLEKPDLILCSEMLDLATFRGLLPDDWNQIPCVLYFHENQLTYPWSGNDQDPGTGRDLHYTWIHVTGMLAASEVWFNSDYHRSTFLKALRPYLKRLPAPTVSHRFDQIEEKSFVMPLGIEVPASIDLSKRDPKAILWNHRWEYDKNPEGFFAIMRSLKEKSVSFRLIILGRSFAATPKGFDQVREEFSNEIIHMGFAETREEYWSWLSRATWAPVTSHHDFFGMSVMEAAAAGVIPLLPDRLSYPELFSKFPELFYQSEEELPELLGNKLQHPDRISQRLRQHISEFEWERVARRYDDRFFDLIE